MSEQLDPRTSDFEKIISIIEDARSRANENPSVGLILCASKDDAVVEYALSRSMSPTLVADYTLYLPDKKVLQDKLRELTELAMDSENIDDSE